MDLSAADDRIAALALQPDGKLLVAGTADVTGAGDLVLQRYTSSGLLDLAFGNRGTVVTDFGGAEQAAAVALQPDGKIVVAGTTDANGPNDFTVARYTTSGRLDPSFDGDGKLTTDFDDGDNVAHALVVQPDGKIVVAGDTIDLEQGASKFALARYTASGSLDSSFDGDGKLTTDFGSGFNAAFALAIQSNGRLIAAGSDATSFALARYTTGGSLDSTFGGDGKVVTSFSDEGAAAVAALAIQPNGNIVAAGQSTDNGDIALARYTSSGNLDSAFSGDGKALTDFGGDDRATALIVQPDGRLVVAGSSNTLGAFDFALARYTSSGSLDSTFSGHGKVTTDFFGGDDRVTALALQPDGKVVAAGFAQIDSFDDFALARYVGGTAVPSATVHLPIASRGP